MGNKLFSDYKVFANLETGKTYITSGGRTPPQGFTHEITAKGCISTLTEAQCAAYAFQETFELLKGVAA